MEEKFGHVFISPDCDFLWYVAWSGLMSTEMSMTFCASILFFDIHWVSSTYTEAAVRNDSVKDLLLVIRR